MTDQPSNISYKEKRRYVRQATLFPVRIFLGDGEAIPSEIRDYCQTGLYVSFVGGGTPDAAVMALVGMPVSVEMSDGAANDFRFKGRVARVTPNALGVFVLTMPDRALKILQQAKHAVAQQASPANKPTATTTSVPTPPNESITGSPTPLQSQTTLKLECTNQFRSFLDAVMQDFFPRAEEHLIEAGLEAFSFLERSRRHPTFSSTRL
ncbi:MAG TPA: PilZ domain-containing protein [Thiobacillus sp.]